MMADDIDVEAMLEAPYARDGHAKSNGHRRRDRSRSRSKERSRRHRSRSRSYDRRRDREFDNRGRYDHRPHHHNRDRDRYRPSRYEEPRDYDRRPPKSSERKHKSPELTPEERDARTVFVWQLSARIRQRDLEDFFTSVGKIKDVRLIMDNKTKRSKGIAYVEFREVESAQLALGLTGTRLLGVPIQIQQSHAEKNRVNATPAVPRPAQQNRGPMKLYIGSLHYNITEEMLKGIFEPFGKIDEIKLIKDPTTGRSQGYGFVTYINSDDAKKALDQLNGFELAGRPMKVNHVTERGEYGSLGVLDNDEIDRAGVDLGTTGRLSLMAKLAEGTGLEIPKAALAQLHISQANPALGSAGSVSSSSATAPPVCTQCFMLSNMFDPHTATHTIFNEIRDDVVEECSKVGGCLHIFVDQTSAQGNVYVKCPSIAVASQCVNMLHGRYFSGRLITAAYVPLINYHQLFPDSTTAKTLLQPSS
ncbi:putative transcriptional coactivator caper rrm superfamily [Fasciola hepatica]|uniref:Transcriptional coactivator caper rrm superfamily n=1 Tax=Fasciola hepatica TaxID=6192 RepID=A0A2H1BVS8_FASHE|nr:putative transcriptional coactivator caper rrm superfamily [Fasciola hepatica]